MSDRETYLGDGLYASYDGFQIKLRAPRAPGIDHAVYLEPMTLQAFMNYVETLITIAELNAKKKLDESNGSL